MLEIYILSFFKRKGGVPPGVFFTYLELVCYSRSRLLEIYTQFFKREGGVPLDSVLYVLFSRVVTLYYIYFVKGVPLEYFFILSGLVKSFFLIKM